MANAKLSGLRWRKSSRSTGRPNCVEVAGAGGAVAARDSKDRDGDMLVFSAQQWRNFLIKINVGNFNA